MTTIAYDGKTLAADRLMVVDDFVIVQRPKCKINAVNAITKSDVDMGHLGVVGDPAYWPIFAGILVSNLEGGLQSRGTLDTFMLGVPEELVLPISKGTTALWVYKGEAYQLKYNGDTLSVYNSGYPYAIGSGGDFALGAMLDGASARRAVEIASKLDIHTGFGVDCIQLNKEHKDAPHKSK
jgi:hypothetical protein